MMTGKSLNGLKCHKGQTWNCGIRVIGKNEKGRKGQDAETQPDYIVFLGNNSFTVCQKQHPVKGCLGV